MNLFSFLTEENYFYWQLLKKSLKKLRKLHKSISNSKRIKIFLIILCIENDMYLRLFIFELLTTK